jgi:predicted nucleotidyltransferase
MSIPGLPESASEAILRTIGAQPQVQRVVLYGSRALGRPRSGSDVDLCLFAPAMNLAELLELGARLDDLLLPWRIDLQLDHLISHDGLRAHIQRAGRVLLDRAPFNLQPS